VRIAALRRRVLALSSSSRPAAGPALPCTNPPCDPFSAPPRVVRIQPGLAFVGRPTRIPAPVLPRSLSAPIVCPRGTRRCADVVDPEGAGQARPGQSSPVAASPLDISGVQSEASSCSGGKRVRFAAARQVRVVSRWMRPGIHTYCASPQEVRVGWCQWLHLCSDSDHQIRAENLIADLAAEERSSNSLPRKSALRSTTDKSLPKKRVTFRDAVTIKHVSNHVQNGSRVTKGPDRIFYQEVAQGSTGGQSDQDWSGVDGGGRVPNQRRKMWANRFHFEIRATVLLTHKSSGFVC
ncbi:hypothetical protein McaMca56_006518, partial [Microsporum canis]